MSNNYQPIFTAFERSRISKELQNEFIQFLINYPEYGSQAIYLLNIKKKSVETVVKDLFDVPIKDQYHWTRDMEQTKHSPLEIDPIKQDAQIQTYVQPRLQYKDWKQEHGFDAPPLEIGDTHTIIRISKSHTPSKGIQHRWEFIKSRYGKRGWGYEKKLKSVLKALLDNNSNPGWIVLSFLEEINCKTDETNTRLPNKELPNSFILNNRDSHILTQLILGHPYFYFENSKQPIRNSGKMLRFKLNQVDNDYFSLIEGSFVNCDKPEEVLVSANSFLDSEMFFKHSPQALIVNNIYYRIEKHSFPHGMMIDAMNGVIIKKSERLDFLKMWHQIFPNITIDLKQKSNAQINTSNNRKIKKWQNWLIFGKENIINYQADSWPHLLLQTETPVQKSNKLHFTVTKNIENIDKLLADYPQNIMLQLVKKGLARKYSNIDKNSFYLNHHETSLLLEYLEEYPFIYNEENQSIFHDSALECSLTIKKNPANPNQYLLQGSIHTKDGENAKINVNNTADLQIFGFMPCYIKYQGKLAKASCLLSSRLINDFLVGVTIEDKEISEFYRSTLPIIKHRHININDPHGFLQVSALYNYKILGNILIWEQEGTLMGHLECSMITDIGEFKYPIHSNSEEFYQKLDDRRYPIVRNASYEAQLLEEIYLDGWVDIGGGNYTMNDENAVNFILNNLPNRDEDALINYKGYKNLKRWQVRRVTPSIFTSINSKINWFDVDIKVACDEQTISVEDIVEMWQQGKQSINLPGKNGIALINQEWIEKNGPLLHRLLKSKREDEKEKEEDRDKFQFDFYNVGLLSYLQEISKDNQADRKWHSLKKTMMNYNGTIEQEIPTTVKADLRKYQRSGVSWLCYMRKMGFCGILADDMGLGKTLQTLAFLAIDRKKKRKFPVLVVAPTSVKYNWEREIKKFTPHFSHILLHGPQRKASFRDIPKVDIVITSYNLLQRDLASLKKFKYSVVILDEAQMIKNFRSKNSQSVNELESEYRISLTGTPIENSISELWSQFNFLMPGFITEKSYLRKGIGEYDNKRHSKKLEILCRLTQPFILRRVKQTVATELPAKTEQVLFCEMNKEQRALYNAVLEYIRSQLKGGLRESAIKQNRFAIFEWMLKLRQICCDPRLSDLTKDSSPASAKLELFLDTLTEIVEEGHRVLVFSQFVKMLNLIRQPLTDRGITFLQLDGSVNGRIDLINRFQDSREYSVFLISLKAGGLGINLTAADYVIHYDPWWNPAAEAQATDRAHRIGQKNKVHVYKLITQDSIEEKIQILQSKKKHLSNRVIKENQTIVDLINVDDLAELFSL